jgi:DNA-binding transcriptional regulator PaaX
MYNLYNEPMNYSKSRRLLVEVLKTGGLVTLVYTFPGMSSVILKPFIDGNKLNKREFNRTVKRLEENKLIGYKDEKDGITIYLKKEGKKKALKYSLDDIEIQRPDRWDKKWRLVMFDIPESKKTARNFLKRKLDDMGFVLIHKSVYVHPFPCENEIDYICALFEIKQYVRTATAEKIDNQNELKKRFEIVQK